MKNIHERKDEKKLILYSMGDLGEISNNVYELCNEFVCTRVTGLQMFIRNDAINADNNNATRLYLIYDNEAKMLVGFYTLSSTCMIRKLEVQEETIIAFEKLVSKVVPCIEIEHFALNERYLGWLNENGYNNRCVGHYIYQQYVRNTILVALENIAFSFVILHAYKHDKVISAYRRMGFETYENDQENLFPVLDGLTPLRGEYTDTCEFMYQSTDDILLYN